MLLGPFPAHVVFCQMGFFSSVHTDAALSSCALASDAALSVMLLDITPSRLEVWVSDVFWKDYRESGEGFQATLSIFAPRSSTSAPDLHSAALTQSHQRGSSNRAVC